MATVTGLTAERMAEIEAAAIVGADIVNNELILERFDGTFVNAGPLDGLEGPPASFAGYTEPLDNKGDVTGSVVLDLSLNNVFRINPTGTVAISFTNLPPANEVATVTIIVANSNFAITWPVGTKFPSATPPYLSGETILSVLARSTGVTVGSTWAGVI